LDIIQLLPDHIANQIAAGEVIQRPSSVVKELVENSIDSGATEIQLLVQDAGKKSIHVIDNGCGMSYNDVEKCFERHATSKIKKTDDLFEIHTMGFRGEAMASIASISHIELETKLHDQELGTKVLLKGSKLIKKEQCSCSNGTSIKIKNLFFNIPARRKFLKSDNVEMRHISEEFNRIALAYPNCKMQFYHNKKELLFLKENNFRQRIVNVIG
jgi:DNA mismatch repair protein MutL